MTPEEHKQRAIKRAKTISLCHKCHDTFITTAGIKMNSKVAVIDGKDDWYDLSRNSVWNFSLRDNGETCFLKFNEFLLDSTIFENACFEIPKHMLSLFFENLAKYWSTNFTKIVKNSVNENKPEYMKGAIDIVIAHSSQNLLKFHHIGL